MPTKAEIDAAKQREAEDAAKQQEADDAAKAEQSQNNPAPPKGENRSNMPPEQRPPGDLRRRARKEKREGPFVKYVGSAAMRKIDPIAWKSLGIKFKEGEEPREDVWSISNDKMIEASKFIDEQLDYLLIDDLQQGTNAHAFLLVDYDDEGQLVQVAY